MTRGSDTEIEFLEYILSNTMGLNTGLEMDLPLGVFPLLHKYRWDEKLLFHTRTSASD